MNDVLTIIGDSLVHRYKFLRELMFFKDDLTGFNQGCLKLTMADKDEQLIQLMFSGVRNLEIQTGAYDVIPLVGLVIEDMTEDQWPGVRFRVMSEDDETHLSFYCWDVVKT